MTRTLRVRAGATMCIGVSVLSLVGCGSTIKPEGAAQSVVDLVSKQTEFKPTDVTCPDGIEAEVGKEFDCTFTGPENVPYTAHMKILKVDGEQVVFDINAKPAE